MLKKYKNQIIYILCVVLSVLFILCSYIYIRENGNFDIHKTETVIARATVTSILEKRQSNSVLGVTDYIDFTAIIKGGSMDGAEVTATQINDIYTAVKMKEVEVGDKVLLSYLDDADNDSGWVMGEYLRTDKLIILGIIFMILLVVFGHIKGISTLLALVFTCLAVFIVLVPSIIGGLNIYFWTIAVCTFIIVMTIILVNGISVKSTVAMIGCFSGVTVCALMTIIMDKVLFLTGIVDDDSTFLLLLHNDHLINLNAVVFASIAIGAVGAIMDVAISMASSLYEVKCQSENCTVKTIMQSGLNIGRDILGTMSNTLILAYIGSSLSTVLLLIAYNSSFIQLFNREMIVVEILQILVGSFGLLLTIPLTTFFSSILYTKKLK